MEPGRLWVAAGEIAAHDRLKGLALQRGAAQVRGHLMAGVVGGLNGHPASMLPFAVTLRLEPGLYCGESRHWHGLLKRTPASGWREMIGRA
jgi:hypothetical protein